MDLCPIIDYKTPIFSREYKDNVNMTQGETSVKNGKTNEPKNHRDTNSLNIPVLN